MLVKAWMLDCDGVLLDTFRNGLTRIKILCAMHDVRYTLHERRKLTEIWGLPGKELLLRGLGISEALAEQMYIEWERYDLAEPPPFVPGAREVLYWLRRNEMKTVLLTSRRRKNLMAILDRKDLLGEFAFLSTKDDCAHSKPDARAFRFALETLEENYGITREHIVFAGDTPADIQGGKNAGIRTIVMQTGPYLLEHMADNPMQAGDILPSIDEIPAWMEKHHDGELPFSYY